MRRISLALALVGAVAATGCGGGAKSSSDATENPGVAGSTFTVAVKNPGAGGYVESGTLSGTAFTADGKIKCGTTFAACSADYAWDPTAPVALRATAAGQHFNGWAGDCLGDGLCSLSGNADKYVVASFSATPESHPNWSDPLVHGAKFRAWAADPAGYPMKCKRCHGATLQGAGIAPSCAQCHASMTLHSGAWFQAKFAAAAPANGPAVTTVCLECHGSQAADFMATQHWTWQGPTPQLFDAGADFLASSSLKNPGTIGKANLINNFCVSVAANEKRCEQCHAGYGNATTNVSARSATYVNDPTRVDCLICHAKSVTGNMAGSAAAPQYNKIAGAFGAAGYAVSLPTGSPTATTAQLQAWATDLQVPTRENCGWCHFNGGGADSVKVMSTALRNPGPSVDVHMSPAGGDLTCADCHADSNHGVKGAGVHTPTNYARTSCESCHGASPHGSAQLNAHLDTVACQTCHIPAYSRGMPGKVDWDWSTAGWKTAAFPHPATIYACVNGTTETALVGASCPTGATKVKKYDYMKGTFSWAQNVPPVYRWYNGKMTHVTTDDKGAFTVETGLTTATSDRITLSEPLGSRTDLTAKIYPFKLMTGRQAVYVDDAAGNSFVITPNLFAETGSDGGFWGVISAQPPGTVHTYAYDDTGMAKDPVFGAPAGPLTGNFSLGQGTFVGTTYGGYTIGAQYAIETLLSNAFAKGATAAGQYSGATMPRFDGTNPGWDWRFTKMYMDLEHEVAPAAQALGCNACHGAAAGTTPFFQSVGYACDPMYDAACRRTP